VYCIRILFHDTVNSEQYLNINVDIFIIELNVNKTIMNVSAGDCTRTHHRKFTAGTLGCYH
jgi:hypothetical protein